VISDINQIGRQIIQVNSRDIECVVIIGWFIAELGHRCWEPSWRLVVHCS